MDDLPKDVLDLLQAERERAGPTPNASARLLGTLGTMIAALPTLPPDPTGLGTSAPTAAKSAVAKGAVVKGTAVKGALAAALAKPMVVAGIAAVSLSVGGAAGVAVDRLTLPAPAVRVVYVDRVVPAPASTALPSIDAGAAATMPSASAAPSPIAPTRPSAEPQTAAGRDRELAAERALLEIARTALGQGDPAAALSSAEQHARRYPSGQLREEREAVAVQALAALGRTAESRARAERFEKQYPSSILLPAVRAAASSAP